MNTISFMSANFVARQLSYRMTEGWGQGDAAAQEWFRPLNTYEERFSEMLGEIARFGFEAMDLWTAHLHWSWATPAHLEIADRCLKKHGLRPVSYAGGFGSSPAELEAACKVCVALGIPVLGGAIPLIESNREAVAQILRRHGLVFGIENHPEKSAAELLEKLGAGDEDVLGVTLDTGWFATQGCDPLEAMDTLLPRLKHVHLKDVKSRPEQPTGFVFKDMGHETCELGTGTVPLDVVIKRLLAAGYRGALSVEHEPEDFDPGPDCQRSHETVKAWLMTGVKANTPPNPVGVAIVGCGNVAGHYARQINTYPHVRLLGAFDIDQSRAEALTRENGGKVYPSLESVLEDPAVEIVVNLTIHHVHAEVIKKCLEAGKHVHTEKPLALDSSTARELVRLAAEKGLRLSSAPTTWLGEAQQTAWRLVREGKIGQPRVAYAEVNWGRIEAWHPNPAPFYDVGVLFDVSVYPLTLLTAWFGPAKRVTAAGDIVFRDRKTKDGTSFNVPREDIAVAVVEFASGVIGRITASFYVGWGSRQSGLEIHGDAGALLMDRWDTFDSPLYHVDWQMGAERVRVIPDAYPARGIEFARGLSDLAHALRENRPHKTTGAHAAHVVEIIEAINTSMREGRAIEVDPTGF